MADPWVFNKYTSDASGRVQRNEAVEDELPFDDDLSTESLQNFIDEMDKEYGRQIQQIQDIKDAWDRSYSTDMFFHKLLLVLQVILLVMQLTIVYCKANDISFTKPVKQTDAISQGTYEQTAIPPLGIAAITIHPGDEYSFDIPEGIMILKSDSDNEELVAGRVISRINGDYITTIEQLQEKLEQYKTGETITLRIVEPLGDNDYHAQDIEIKIQ